MKKFIDQKRVHKLSIGDSMVPMEYKVIKLQEESGELAQAFLKYSNSKNTSASAGGLPIDVIEEAGDCVNVAMDIINAMVMRHPELEQEAKEMFNAKLDKWERKQEAY